MVPSAMAVPVIEVFPALPGEPWPIVILPEPPAGRVGLSNFAPPNIAKLTPFDSELAASSVVEIPLTPYVTDLFAASKEGEAGDVEDDPVKLKSTPEESIKPRVFPFMADGVPVLNARVIEAAAPG